MEQGRDGHPVPPDGPQLGLSLAGLKAEVATADEKSGRLTRRLSIIGQMVLIWFLHKTRHHARALRCPPIQARRGGELRFPQVRRRAEDDDRCGSRAPFADRDAARRGGTAGYLPLRASSPGSRADDLLRADATFPGSHALHRRRGWRLRDSRRPACGEAAFRPIHRRGRDVSQLIFVTFPSPSHCFSDRADLFLKDGTGTGAPRRPHAVGLPKGRNHSFFHLFGPVSVAPARPMPRLCDATGHQGPATR